MGPIQSSINQMLGTAAIATKLSPAVKKAKELKGLEKEASTINELSKNITPELPKVRKNASIKSIEKLEESQAGQQAVNLDILKRRAELDKKRLMLKGTPENYQKAIESQRAYEGYSRSATQFNKMLESKRKEAVQRALDLSKQKEKQKAEFYNNLYLYGQKIDVSKLGPEAKKQIERSRGELYGK